LKNDRVGWKEVKDDGKAKKKEKTTID